MNATRKNAFVSAAMNTPVLARTQNNMKAQESSMSPLVDLFYIVGASRGKNLSRQFESALQDNEDLALRVALWARDARGGAGEREVFKFLLTHLEQSRPEFLLNSGFLAKVPELGRWDDLLVLTEPRVKAKAFDLIKSALESGNGLAAKWMPRKGKIARELREHFGMSPKAYRKTLVGLSNTVEQKLCAREFDQITTRTFLRSQCRAT